ncbi:hypothetical protein O0I10_007862 [Lichtheimia ornata]|uniref:Exonuclease domain-containing protein n=1 Tax=Lichtheimia ornata TaxID=688661 RepID=A0AAD7XTK8_9FUNG|nr:uncharacterized protein O0I10_007862 [Lichtheimia ornata]KAJ8656539.1 hypothetical protein O0I10_007862 [Lichtheimia ornata]
MLPSTGLFRKLTCPYYPNCPRITCIYSHDAPPSAQVSRKRKAAATDLKNKSNDPAVKKKQIDVDNATTTTKSQPSTMNPKRPNRPVSENASSTTIQRQRQPPTSTSSTLNKPASSDIRRKVTSASSSLQQTSTTTPSFSSSGPRRIAHTTKASTSATGPPIMKPNMRSHAPLKLRQTTVQRIYDHFIRIYAPLIQQHPALASEHTERQEAMILEQTTNQAGYKQMAMNVLVQLKKRPESTGIHDVGITSEWTEPSAGNDNQSLADRAQPYVLTQGQMQEMRYPTTAQLEESASATETHEAALTVGTTKKCDRCKKEYVVKDVLGPQENAVCVFHYGKMRNILTHGEKQRTYTCCGESHGSAGCAKGPHVYKDEAIQQLHAKIPYVSTPQEKSDSWRSLIALDCEMAYTTAGMELIRLTAIDGQANMLIDELVFPSHMVIDLNTRYSGIKTLAGAKHNLESVRQELFKYINADTILLGHGLENDMNALRLIHDNIIDTVALYPHPKGLPFRYGLRLLANKHLSKFIQDTVEGHDSYEDSKTCIELLEAFLKLQNKQ